MVTKKDVTRVLNMLRSKGWLTIDERQLESILAHTPVSVLEDRLLEDPDAARIFYQMILL